MVNEKNSLKILITGGFGFIGGRLGQQLIQNKYEVILGSRKFKPPPTWLSQAKVAEICWDDQISLNSVCHDVDTIIHAAGMNASDCASNPEEALRVNGTYTEYIVKSAIKNKVKKIIYLSTSHVYATELEGKISEISLTTNSHPYAISNLAGEKAILDATKKGKINGIVLRLSNTFGVPVHSQVDCWHLLVNDLCRQAVSKKELVLKSSGLQMRDFVSMTDVCGVIKYLIETDRVSQLNNIVNVGSGKSHSVFGMAQIIHKFSRDLWGVKPNIFKTKSYHSCKINKFDFQMNWLNHNNYIFTDNFDGEIKRLLEFCKVNFS